MSVEQRLTTFINDTLVKKAEGVGPDESLLESGVIDSVGIVEVITFIENEFDVKVADEDVVPENFETIQNLCRYVVSRQHSGGTAS